MEGINQIKARFNLERMVNMQEITKGTRVFHTKSEQYGVIEDLWNNHSPYPTGYLVVTDDEIHHICLEEDFGG